jgi:transcriptional regulator with XRE-family HTH domain
VKLRCTLRAVRGERTLVQLAERSGVSVPILSQIERGRMLPLDKDIGPLEEAYGLPLAEWYESDRALAVAGDE